LLHISDFRGFERDCMEHPDGSDGPRL
jgi:hypothetical protein